MSPLILLVLEPDIPGEADFVVGLATWSSHISLDSSSLEMLEEQLCIAYRTYGWNVNMLDTLLGLY